MLCHKKRRRGYGAFLILCSHHIFSAGDFFMRRSFILAGVAARPAGSLFRRRPCAAADPARAGRRPRMPRRRQRRLHRRLGDQSRLRAARRRHAGGPLCRHHPQGRRRSRHHPGNRRWPGACSRRRRGLGRAISPAIMPARRAALRSASVPAATCWSAVRTNSIALQPLSVQGQVGLNVAAGLESLELRPGR